MNRRTLRRRIAPLALCLSAALGVPAAADGFSVDGQGAKAAGLAGAFAARADDGSAVWYNPAGLGFQLERSQIVGFSLSNPGDTEFSGALPFPGPTQSGASDDHLNVPIHAFWVEPIGGSFTLGVGLYQPFYSKLDWRDPSAFSGRYISTFSEVSTLDLSADLAWRVNDRFSIGGGIIARFSTLEWQKRLPTVEPFTGQVLDFARFDLESDTDIGFTIDFGLLYKLSDAITWGLTYRGPLGLEYDVDTKLTQISTGNSLVDDLLADDFPLGQTVQGESEIEFPEQLTMGLLVEFGPRVAAELDVTRSDWGTLERVAVTFRNAPQIDSTITLDGQEAFAYRLGISYRLTEIDDLRFGYAYEESAVAERYATPFFVDASADVFTAGYGRPIGPVRVDVALQFHDVSDVTTGIDNDQGFSGSYTSDRWLLVGSVGF